MLRRVARCQVRISLPYDGQVYQSTDKLEVRASSCLARLFVCGVTCTRTHHVHAHRRMHTPECTLAQIHAEVTNIRVPDDAYMALPLRPQPRPAPPSRAYATAAPPLRATASRS